MTIVVNGKNVEIEDNASVSDLLIFLNLDKKMVAVEVSGEILTKSEQASYIIQPQNTIEIIKAVGGG